MVDMVVHYVLGKFDSVGQLFDSLCGGVELSLHGAMIVGVLYTEVFPAVFDLFAESPDRTPANEISRILGLNLEVVRIPDTPAVPETNLRHDFGKDAMSKGVVVSSARMN